MSRKDRTGMQEQASPHLSRRRGVYPQKHDGLYMQRIRISGGRIGAEQWRRLAELSAAYCGAAPLHLTTRQDIELHNVPADHVAAVEESLAEVGLQTYNACGDSIRNITLCPGCDLREGGADLLGVIETLYACLVSLPVSDRLPRKFKISFSACEWRCALPFLNDLGFVLTGRGRFVVFGAGSLGPRPNLGIELADDLGPEEVIAFTAAVLEIFEERGDRTNRRKARLRHVREHTGDEAFRDLLRRRFEEKSAGGDYPGVSIRRGKAVLPHVRRLYLPAGDLEIEQALALAELIDGRGVQSRLTLTQGIELYSSARVELSEPLVQLSKGPSIVCCPGADTCVHGAVHTRRLAQYLRENLPRGFDGTIRISGCPNHCTHTAAAQIGLSGCKKAVDGETHEAYRVYLSGGDGKSDRLSSPGPAVLEEEVLRYVCEVRRSEHGTAPPSVQPKEGV